MVEKIKTKINNLITNEKFMKTFNIIVMIACLGIAFNTGCQIVGNLYKNKLESLTTQYNELVEEYEDYKKHSWILLG